MGLSVESETGGSKVKIPQHYLVTCDSSLSTLIRQRSTTQTSSVIGSSPDLNGAIGIMDDLQVLKSFPKGAEKSIEVVQTEPCADRALGNFWRRDNTSTVIPGKTRQHFAQGHPVANDLALAPREGVLQVRVGKRAILPVLWRGEKIIPRFQSDRLGLKIVRIAWVGLDGTFEHGDLQDAGIVGPHIEFCPRHTYGTCRSLHGERSAVILVH